MERFLLLVHQIRKIAILLIFFVIGCNQKNDKFIISTLKYKTGQDSVVFKCYIFNGDTLRTGQTQIFDKDHSLLADLNYKNNLLDGLQSYYKNGIIEQKIFYVDGLINGEAFFYTENGTLKTKSF